MNDRAICQSCAMPLKRDEDFGVEIDGNMSQDYCKYCYIDGEFQDEGISLDEKIEKLVKMSVGQLMMTEEQARKMATNILPTLKRWKKE